MMIWYYVYVGDRVGEMRVSPGHVRDRVGEMRVSPGHVRDSGGMQVSPEHRSMYKIGIFRIVLMLISFDWSMVFG